MQGEQVVRMVPYKDGGANEGHSCVKGRFAWGYASHPDRMLEPMIRENIDDEWQIVSWDEAIAYTAAKLLDIQARHGNDAIGGITSSRCTNEEVFVVQKMVRTAFGNNNVDTCARVCHSPTGFGLNSAFGTSAGTQDFKSVEQADVILLIGANPTDAHPVFASRMKRRLRDGAKLIVVDPRRIDLVRTPHVEAAALPAAAAGHQRRRRQRAGPRDRHRGPRRPSLRRRALRPGQLRRCGPQFVALAGEQPGGDRAAHRRAGRRACVPRRACTPPAATPRSTTASASPSTARAARW